VAGQGASELHISEGFLSPAALAAGAAVAASGVAIGLKRMDPDKIVRVAMASSVFFLASLVNIKIGPAASTHLSLVGAMGLLLGWCAFPAIFTALLLQAVLFQFGGLLVLGANTASMGTAAICAHLLFGRAARSESARVAAAASFAAGSLAVLLGAMFVGAWLSFSDPRMITTAKAVLVAHIPLAILEGIATLFMTLFLRRAYPDVMKDSESI
jgi:cobalt/nickel transport system permease protein